jgi:hypothetical protein
MENGVGDRLFVSGTGINHLEKAVVVVNVGHHPPLGSVKE